VSDQSGQAVAFMALTPIRPGEEAPLRAYLEALKQDASPFAKLERTHFARWVILKDFVSDASQPHEDHLDFPYLVFTSNFDEPEDTYLDDLCTLLAAEAEQIWGRCAGCPSPAAGPALKQYLLRHRVKTGFFVAAYKDAPVAEVKASLALRETMIDLAVRSQSMTPQDLQAAFLAAVGTA
jgi:hypothetical protein